MPTPSSNSTPAQVPSASSASVAAPGAAVAAVAPRATLTVLVGLSCCHLLNDAIQALIPAIYPLLKDSLHLSFSQIGMITLTFQMVGSVFQPVIGLYTDRHPKPHSLVAGMAVTWMGLVLLALASTYPAVLMAAGMIGFGSAVFHPESSRMARLASGGRHGFAQSLFQVGGNAGTALGPLLAAGVVVPHGQRHVLWFSVLAVTAMAILRRLGGWYQACLAAMEPRGGTAGRVFPRHARREVALAVSVLLLLMFSKFFYLAAMTNYYTFYLMDRFGLSIGQSQVYLFLYLGAGAVGTIAGGPIGDRIGRKQVIWLSILGVAPFALAMPHAELFGTALLSVCTGLILSSAFPAILVYAIELLPGNVGLVAGLFFGLAFGLAGIGSAVLGWLADATSIRFVIQVCAFLPLLGLATWFLPDLRTRDSS